MFKKKSIFRRRHFSKDQTVDLSLNHSLKDSVAHSVMQNGGETFFSAYALFLKATTAEIGILSSFPVLIGSFIQLISAWLGHRTGKRKQIILAGTTLQALSWLPIIFLPILIPNLGVQILIWGIIIYYVGANLSMPQWSSLMGDLVPEDKRGRYFALRTKLASIYGFIALIFSGLILHFFDGKNHPLAGYILIFSIAAFSRFISVYHLFQMHDPYEKVAALEIPFGRKLWKRLLDSHFVRFSLFFAAMQFAVAIASPYFTVYLLRDLKFSYLEFMCCTATTVLLQFFTLNMWGRVGDFFGNRLILKTTGAIIPFLPALWLVSESIWYILIIQALAGAVWAGFSLSSGNFLYDLIPAEKRVTYLAIHNVLATIGLFLGAMLGAYIGMKGHGPVSFLYDSNTPINAMKNLFVISFITRMTIAILFLPKLKEVRKVPPLSIALIYRVAGVTIPLSGIIFEVVGKWKRRSKQIEV